MILVTKTHLPLRKSFEKYVDRIYASNWLTNFGQLEQELTDKLKEFLEVDNLLLTSNGTLAMQVVYKALCLNGEVITTPFSFVATTSSLDWSGLKPIFVDIDINSLNLDSKLIADKITSKTSAILPVHVFGRACQVEEIQKVADANNVKVIYDAAHAFNVRMNNTGESILNFGDVSTLSFHAAKLFHTIEGGAIVSKDGNLIKECRKLINFGITGYDQIDGGGINCKMNEFSAAMGLAVLENIDFIMDGRAKVDDLYRKFLPSELIPLLVNIASNNHSYFPILLKDEEKCLKVRNALITNDIMPRRYFYPSLDTLSYVGKQFCPISRNISSRILCLPMYETLLDTQIQQISNIIMSELSL